MHACVDNELVSRLSVSIIEIERLTRLLVTLSCALFKDRFREFFNQALTRLGSGESRYHLMLRANIADDI